MFVVFGNGAKKFVEAEGKFICPKCNFIKRYLVKTSKDYFRLFFIPLIPIGEKSQPFVECQHCKTKCNISVLYRCFFWSLILRYFYRDFPPLFLCWNFRF